MLDQRALTYYQLAYCLRSKPDPDWAGAIDAYRQAEALERDAPPDQRAPTYYQLAHCLHNKPDPDWAGAIDAYRQALGLAESLGDARSQSLVLYRLAHLKDREGHPDEALKLYQRSLALDEHLGDLQGQVRVLYGMISLHTRQGRREEAESLSRRARGLQRVQRGLDAAALGDPLILMVGEGLIPIFDPDRGGTMLSRIKMMREQLRAEHNFELPPVRIVDSPSLLPDEYALFIDGQESLVQQAPLPSPPRRLRISSRRSKAWNPWSRGTRMP